MKYKEHTGSIPYSLLACCDHRSKKKSNNIIMGSIKTRNAKIKWIFIYCIINNNHHIKQQNIMKLLFEAIQEYDDIQLLHYLQEKIKNRKRKCKEVLQRMCTYNPQNSDDSYSKKGSCTPLHFALSCNKSKEVISGSWTLVEGTW